MSREKSHFGQGVATGEKWGKGQAVAHKKSCFMKLSSYSNPSSKPVHHSVPVLGIPNIPTSVFVERDLCQPAENPVFQRICPGK